MVETVVEMVGVGKAVVAGEQVATVDWVATEVHGEETVAMAAAAMGAVTGVATAEAMVAVEKVGGRVEVMVGEVMGAATVEARAAGAKAVERVAAETAAAMVAVMADMPGVGVVVVTSVAMEAKPVVGEEEELDSAEAMVAEATEVAVRVVEATEVAMTAAQAVETVVVATVVGMVVTVVAWVGKAESMLRTRCTAQNYSIVLACSYRTMSCTAAAMEADNTPLEGRSWCSRCLVGMLKTRYPHHHHRNLNRMHIGMRRHTTRSALCQQILTAPEVVR